MLSERALERRVKRYLRKEFQQWFVIGAPSFEPELEAEVRALPDVDDLKVVTGGVAFRGPLDTVYHANLRLRTAHRVLLRIRTFLAQTYPMMFDHARRVPWELYIGFSPSFTFRVHASRSRLRHKENISRTLADGAVHRLESLGLPGIYEKDASIEFHVRLLEDRCTLSLNTSGEHLHKRGYRTHVTDAPVRETIAAAVLLASGAEQFNTFIDPFCGSGTLLIEAAMLRASIAPGVRRRFAFQECAFNQENKWGRIRDGAVIEEQRGLEIQCIGNDLDPKSLEACRKNAEAIGVQRFLSLTNFDATRMNLASLLKEKAKPLLVSNLPYGVRISPGTSRKIIESFTANLLSYQGDIHFALLTTESSTIISNRLTEYSARRFHNGPIPTTFSRGRYSPV